MDVKSLDSSVARRMSPSGLKKVWACLVLENTLDAGRPARFSKVWLKFDELPTPKDRVYTRDAHSECNIPAHVGSGLVPDRKGSGVGSVTSTPRDNVHTQNAKNVIFEKRKNNLWEKYPTPAPCGQAQDLTLQRDGDMSTHLLLTTNCRNALNILGV